MNVIRVNVCTKRLALIVVLWLFVIGATSLWFYKRSYNEEKYEPSTLAKKLKEYERENTELKTFIDDISNRILESGFHVPNIEKLLIKEEKPKVKEKPEELPLKPIESINNTNISPPHEYESMRRRIFNNVKSLWYLVRSRVNLLKKELSSMLPKLASRIGSTLELAEEHERYLKNELSVMGEIDGFSAWRENEAIKLSDLVQRRLKFLQNPPSCDKAKKLVCSLNKKCGYGCQIHHLAYCMIIAYGTEHTLILDSKEWSYHKGGWEEVFQPLSNNCTNKGDAHFTLWPGIDGEDQNLLLPFVDYLKSPPPYLPLAVPEDLVPRLLKFHGFPFIWWIGQILKYLLQPQETTQKLIDEAANKLNFRKPIVGQVI
uniref:GT23 domain-containing protein n=1 Tax=Timema monikensis TaxID=170555 RepID=A0A7R9EHT7_9NEOP|nr:unnamed protein product [Timema monikensis]